MMTMALEEERTMLKTYDYCLILAHISWDKPTVNYNVCKNQSSIAGILVQRFTS